MLTMRKRVNERTDISETIAMFVLEIGNDNVKLGISVPREVNSIRAEKLPKLLARGPPISFQREETLPRLHRTS
jgi:carbon storage regulator CsrA